MKSFLELELFGDDVCQKARFYKNLTNELIPGMGALFEMPPSAWVAEITGFDKKFKYARSFLKAKKDYSRSNSKSSRGIFAEYILESGRIYEIKAKVSWKSLERYFCIVSEQGEIVKISENEVIECLKKLLK